MVINPWSIFGMSFLSLAAERSSSSQKFWRPWRFLCLREIAYLESVKDFDVGFPANMIVSVIFNCLFKDVNVVLCIRGMEAPQETWWKWLLTATTSQLHNLSGLSNRYALAECEAERYEKEGTGLYQLF